MFTRSGGIWSQQTKLTAGDAAAGRQKGSKNSYFFILPGSNWLRFSSPNQPTSSSSSLSLHNAQIRIYGFLDWYLLFPLLFPTPFVSSFSPSNFQRVVLVASVMALNVLRTLTPSASFRGTLGVLFHSLFVSRHTGCPISLSSISVTVVPLRYFFSAPPPPWP